MNYELLNLPSPNVKETKRWEILLEQATNNYAEACRMFVQATSKTARSIERHNKRYWKRMIEWIDKELAKLGEL